MEKKPLKKLIFVDDDPDILTVSKYCLEDMEGVEIKFLSSGEEAIQEALSFKPDLILLDVMMPSMDGITTMNTLKQLPTVSATPVVLITAKIQQEEIARYLKEGAVDIIHKPFDPLTLTETILKVWESYQSKITK